jgi:hypothetical protein
VLSSCWRTGWVEAKEGADEEDALRDPVCRVKVVSTFKIKIKVYQLYAFPPKSVPHR